MKLFFPTISILLSLARAAAADDALPLTLVIPEPARAPRITIHEETEAPRYYSADHPMGWLGTRLAFGVTYRSQDQDGKAFFATDAFVTGRLGILRGNPQLALTPEIGYSNYGLFLDSAAHTLQAGVGAGLLSRGVMFSLVPRFIYGEIFGERAFGGRVSLMFESIGRHSLPIVDVSYAHEVTSDRTIDELRLMVGIDPWAVFSSIGTPRTNCPRVYYGNVDGACD